MPTPVGVLLGRSGQVRLLGLGNNILELDEHQPGTRAGEISENGVAELSRIDRFAALGQELADVILRAQSLAEQGVAEPSAIARSAGDSGAGRNPVMIKSNAFISSQGD